MNVYAVFRHPADAPEHFVVRQWIIRSGREELGPAWYELTLEEARQHIPAGLFRLPPQPGDPPFLIESWV